ncbi:MAG TPA: tRNA (adenosine(37)-N6)-threonylcarbamoyltransferase complex dimerization subunit type 1 TsaB [Dehalococcoidia bacterium]
MADRPLLLAIDTASDAAGAALMDGDSLLAESTWHAHQSHSVQLLPAVDWLLSHVRRTKAEIGAVAVCLGPGSYAGMRVGISTAKALAFGLDARIVGIGRLAAEALPVAEASGARVVPVQAAGRAELAWAFYQHSEGELVELSPPRLGSSTELLGALRKGDVVTGDVDRLDPATVGALTKRGCRLVPASSARVVAVARLGLCRLARGEADDADTLVPLYLRAPAIGPQPPR